MNSDNPAAEARRICQVLHGIAFPAAKWQLIMCAEAYGADSRTRHDLWALPDGEHRDIRSVLAALGLMTTPALGLEMPASAAS